jgi:hypothetical protein
MEDEQSKSSSGQQSIFDLPEDLSTPAQMWDRDLATRSLDELFTLARKYNSSQAYHDLLKFIARFRFYSPFNAMLVHIQMPGATFAAPPSRWFREYGRRIKAEGRPLAILQPMGPVMFVFDVSDTEPDSRCKAASLPPEVEHPFDVLRGKVHGELTRTIENVKRDGVSVTERQAGSQSAGQISVARPGRYLEIQIKQEPEPEFVRVPLRYELLMNAAHFAEAKYATLVHELGHLYCGHIGSPNDRWWPDRRGLPNPVCEFEAESICYLVCSRLGIENPSDQYLAGYIRRQPETPPISLECVMKSAGLVERMGRERLKPRKDQEG